MSSPRNTVAFLFPAFPVLHQTFVLWEVLALRQRGVEIRIYSLKRPSTTTQQPEGARLAAEVRYLPGTLSRQVLAANWRTFTGSPRRYLGVLGRLAREWWRDRDAKSLWSTAPEDTGESLLTWRERARGFYNANPFIYLLKSMWLVLTAVHLGEELRREGIKRVHAHWASYPTTVALVVRWLFGVPFSFSAHAYDIYLVPRLLGVKVREAEFAVTCARVNGGYLQSLAGPGRGRIVVNYHGVALDRFRPVEAAPSEPPTIVTCGRLQIYKGHHLLLRACAALRQPVRCVLIGEGPQRGTLEQLARTLGIADRVTFTGPLPQEQVARIYAGATLFVLSSVVVASSGKRDVIPNVLAEAMAMRIPVVSTDVSGIGELVTDGVSGRLVRANDPGTLADVMNELLEDPEQRRRLAEGGYRKVVAEFDRSQNIRVLSRLFLGDSAPADEAIAPRAAGSGEAT